jgi:hypothetical protein
MQFPTVEKAISTAIFKWDRVWLFLVAMMQKCIILQLKT